MIFSPLKIIHTKQRKQIFPLDTFAPWITKQVGTMSFFGIILLGTILWLIWNTIAPSALRFDSCPAFALWIFLSNMLQICLLPLLMIGQNLDAKNAETRGKQEIERILMHLNYHNQMLRDLMDQYETQHKELMHHTNWLHDRESLVIASPPCNNYSSLLRERLVPD